MGQYSHKSRYLKEALSLNYSDRQWRDLANRSALGHLNVRTMTGKKADVQELVFCRSSPVDLKKLPIGIKSYEIQLEV
jgi:hypothetical protein